MHEYPHYDPSRGEQPNDRNESLGRLGRIVCGVGSVVYAGFGAIFGVGILVSSTPESMAGAGLVASASVAVAGIAAYFAAGGKVPSGEVNR